MIISILNAQPKYLHTINDKRRNLQHVHAERSDGTGYNQHVHNIPQLTQIRTRM